MHLMYYGLFTKVSAFYAPAFQWSRTFNSISHRGRQQQWSGNWSFIDLIEKNLLFSSFSTFSISHIFHFPHFTFHVMENYNVELSFVWNCRWFWKISPIYIHHYRALKLLLSIIYIPDGLLIAIRKENKVKLHGSFELLSRMC